MTLTGRDTIIDRPELVNRDNDEDEQDEGEQEVNVLGDGGGPTVHNVEFEEGDLDIVAAANTCAVLTTGEDEGDVFEQMFANASVQLKDLKNRNRDISMLSYFGLNNSIGTVGLSDDQSAELMTELMGEVEDGNEDVQNAEEASEEPEQEEQDTKDLEEVEKEVDEISEEDGE